MVGGVELDSLRGREFKGLFEQEWRLSVTDELTEQIVAIVAHSHHRLTVRSLSEVLEVGEDAVFSALGRISFLQIEPEESYVSFASRAFADFASDRLSDRRAEIIDELGFPSF